MSMIIPTFEEIKTLEVTSAAFADGGFIPEKYTCDGMNVNPPLSIKKLPENTQSLVILVEDPDAPYRNFIHWVVWNVPTTRKITENFSKGIQGYNDFKLKEYRGPCPPKGTHQYHFKIYALDAVLDTNSSGSICWLEKEIGLHLLAFGELTCLYRRK